MVPGLELGANGEVVEELSVHQLGANGEVVEELSVHQLAQELQESTGRLMQLDTLADSLLLEVAEHKVTIDDQQQQIEEQKQLLSLSAEKMAKLTSDAEEKPTHQHHHQPPPPQQQKGEEEAPAGKFDALDSVRGLRTLVYGVCTAMFFVVLVS